MDFLTDEQMAKLEQGGQAPDMLSDEQMAALEKQSPPSRPGQAALEGFGQTATMGYLPQLQALAEEPMNQVLNAATGRWSPEEQVHSDNYLQSRDENLRRQRELSESNPVASMAGKAAGIGATMLLPGGAAKTVGQAAKQGAIMGAAYNPGDTEGELSPIQAGDRALAALFGAGGNVAGYGASKGLEKLGGKLMNRAVGARKVGSDVGSELMDQGVYGTKEQMQRQVSDRIGSRSKELNNAVSSLSDDLDVSPIAEKLQTEAGKLRTGGQVPPNLQSALGQYDELATFLTGQSKMSPKDLLKFKQSQGDLAYNASGTPGASYAADAARRASREAGDMLKSAYSSKFPGQANAVADSNAGLRALLKAKSGLEKSESLSDIASSLGIGGAGYAAGGPIGLVAGAIDRTNIGKATEAYTARGLSKAVGASTPALRQSLFETLREKK